MKLEYQERIELAMAKIRDAKTPSELKAAYAQLKAAESVAFALTFRSDIMEKLS